MARAYVRAFLFLKIMKKFFIVICFVAIYSATFSQTSADRKMSKKIVGSWENTETIIDKLDEMASYIHDSNSKYLQEQIDLYNSQLDQLDDSSKIYYEQVIEQIEQQKNLLTIDSIKHNLKTNSYIGSFVFEKKGIVLITKEGAPNVKGSWRVSDNGKSLHLYIERDDVLLNIAEVSKNKLKLEQKTNMDTLEFTITYILER